VIFALTNKDPKRDKSKKMDLEGTAYLVVSLVSLMFGLNKSSEWGATSLTFWSVMALSAVSFLLLIRVQRKKSSPLIPMDLLANKAFSTCSAAYVAFSYSFSSALFLLGLYMQSILEYSAMYAGTVFIAMTLTMGVLSPFGGTLTDKIGGRAPIGWGMAVIAVASVLFSTFSPSTSVYQLVGVLVFLGLGFGVVNSALNTVMLKSVKEDEVSTGSGTFTMIGTFANSLGVVISTELLLSWGKKDVFSAIQSSGLSLSWDQLKIVESVMSSTHYDIKKLSEFSPEIFTQLMTHINASFVSAMGSTMLVCAFLSSIGTLIVFKGLKKQKNSNKLFISIQSITIAKTVLH